jgi:hypothetical protein
LPAGIDQGSANKGSARIRVKWCKNALAQERS